jgi:uncharacterized protein (DUF433 family)
VRSSVIREGTARGTASLFAAPRAAIVWSMKTWIAADAEHLGGRPRVRDTRVSVAQLLECLAADMTIAEIVDAYPSLTEEAVRGVLAELAKAQEKSAA